VAPDDLRTVLQGNDPRSGERLVGWRKRPGYDLTLSAPKSVSLLWGLGDQSTAAAVAAAHEDAVDAAVAYLEDAACFVRRGRGGRIRLPGAGLVGAAFRHRTSRAGDPNLHSHVVVANMTRGSDGQWSALFSQAVFRHGRTAGFIYQAVLRHRLATQLGVGFGDASRGVREVEGVSATVRRAFSRRRVAIEVAMAEHGAHSKHGAQVAALDTRPDKQPGVSEATLRRAWREQAREIGFDLDAVAGGSGPGSAAVPHDELGRRLTERHATFDRRAVLRAVAEAAVRGLTYPQIMSRAEGFLSSDEAVEVSPGRWTTPEMLAIEADAFRLAESGPPTSLVPAELVATALAERPSLSAEQGRAVETVTTGDGPVALVVGHAGTGKTFALDAARAAWQASGHQVIGAALAARAARQLQVGSGIPSSTVAAVLADLESGRLSLAPTTVLVVDEAGMVGSRHLHRLLQVTTTADARLVLVGDHRQLAEIDASGLFVALARRLGCAELSENRRQRDPAQRAVVRALRDHDAERALLRLRRMGRLTALHNAEHVRDRMAEDWLLEHRDNKQAVMLALHRSDVADLNRRARARLRAVGELGEPVLSVDGVDFAVGDRVMALRHTAASACSTARGPRWKGEAARTWWW